MKSAAQRLRAFVTRFKKFDKKAKGFLIGTVVPAAALYGYASGHYTSTWFIVGSLVCLFILVVIACRIKPARRSTTLFVTILAAVLLSWIGWLWDVAVAPAMLPFSEITERFSVKAGPNSIEYSKAHFKTNEMGIVAFKGSEIRLGIHHGSLYLSGELRDVRGGPEPVIKIYRNKVTMNRAGWDHNWNKTALEIVDQNRLPVFQVYQNTESSLGLRAWWPTGDGGVFCMNEKTSSWFYLPTNSNDLVRIFKYPAWRHKGQMVEKAN